MRQKLALAGALIHEPEVMLLDEPLTGLDAEAARMVKDILIARVRSGCTVVLTTHILEVAERLAGRISIIAGGRIAAQGTMAELRHHAGQGETLEDVFLALVAAPRGMRLARPGSASWLLAHELRILWRSFGIRSRIIGGLGVIFVVLAHVGGYFMVKGRVLEMLLARSPGSAIVITVFVVLLVLSSAFGLAVRVLLERGDLELLLATPMPMTTIYGVRGVTVAVAPWEAWAFSCCPSRTWGHSRASGARSPRGLRWPPSGSPALRWRSREHCSSCVGSDCAAHAPPRRCWAR
jgi:ABC-type multidrug transport system, ATPase component